MTELLLPEIPRVELSYADYRAQALDCDIALWEPTSWYGRVIATATDGPFSHISGILWWEDVLMSAGYEEGRGGFVEPLKTVVTRYPGVVSIFRVRNEVNFNQATVKQALRGRLGYEYRWSNIRLLALMNLPVVRWFRRGEWFRNKVQQASRYTGGGICSEHIARSFAEDKVVFVRKAVATVTPNDIAQSGIVEYVGTLTEVTE